jgi:hypothetical protein
MTANPLSAETRAHYKQSQKFGYCEFEIDPVDCSLSGYINASVYEGGPPEGKQDPTTIVSCNEDLYVKVEWQLYGHLVQHLCGYFCVCVYLESIGPGKDYSLDCDNTGQPCLDLIEMNPCGDGKYEAICRIPANSIDCGDCGRLYEIAVTLTSLNYCKKPGHIAAYCKGPCIMFYEPEEE